MTAAEARERILAEWARLTPNAPASTHEAEVLLPGGRRRIEQWSQTGIFDAHGRLVGVQGVGRDVTEQRDAERALQESEERYRAVVEDLTEIICRCDRNFVLTFANEAQAGVIGVPAEELVGRDFFEGIPQHAAPSLRQRLLALTPEQPTDVSENEKVFHDGSVRWLHWTNRALFDARGQITGYQAVGRDITELKQTEAALREREALLSAIIETQTEWVARQDRTGRFTFINRAYCRYMGMTPEQFFSPDYDDFNSMVPEDQDRFKALRAAAAPHCPTYTMDVHHRHPDGSDRVEEWTETTIFDVAGRPTGYQAVGRDVTTQHLAERALQESEERYRAVAEDLTEVVGRCDANFKLTFANAAHARMVGAPAEALVGKDFFTAYRRTWRRHCASACSP